MPQEVMRFNLAAGMTRRDLVELVCQVYGYQDQVPEAADRQFTTNSAEEAQAKIAEIREQGWQLKGDYGRDNPDFVHDIRWFEPILVPNPQSKRKFARDVISREFAAMLTAIRDRKHQMDAAAATSELPPIEVVGDE